MNRQRERGFVGLKTIFVLLILGVVAYLAVSILPLYYNNYMLQDKMKEEARFAVANHRTPEQLRDIIFKEAQNLGVPIRADDIRVEMNSEGTSISTEYAITVDLHVYQFTLQFKADSGRS